MSLFWPFTCSDFRVAGLQLFLRAYFMLVVFYLMLCILCMLFLIFHSFLTFVVIYFNCVSIIIEWVFIFQ